MFKVPDGFQDFISSVCNGERSSRSGCISGSGLGSQGVDLADGEPSEGGEHKVEQVLTNMDHDVLILEDSFLHNFAKKRKIA